MADFSKSTPSKLRNASLRSSKTTAAALPQAARRALRFVLNSFRFFTGPSLIGASSSSRCERLPVRGDRSNLAGALEGGGLGSFPMAIADRKRRWTESECRQSATACFGNKRPSFRQGQAPSWAESMQECEVHRATRPQRQAVFRVVVAGRYIPCVSIQLTFSHKARRRGYVR